MRRLTLWLGLLVLLAACSDAAESTIADPAAPAAPTATTAPEPLPGTTAAPPTAAAPTTTPPPQTTTVLTPTTSVTPTTVAPTRLRVLSYNIHHGAGVDGEIDLDRIAAVIASVEPDIVGLQEVEQGTERTDGVDQPAVLGALTGMDHAFGRNLDFRGGGFGNAILSRLPINSSGNVLLTAFDDGEQRGVLTAEVTLPGEAGPVRVLVTHLDHRDDPAERINSAQEINQLMANLGGVPAVLLGDLNDVRGSAPLRRLAATWAVVGDVELPTFPVEQPDKQIDFVLYSPPARWAVVEVRVLDEAVASDHRAIFAVLELRP